MTWTMTDGPPDRRVRKSESLPVGLLIVAPVAGAGLGVIARLWMRWISTDPEFTWAGTIGIVAAFTMFASAQAAAAVVRRQRSRPLAVASARALAAVLSLGLFGAAGSVMLPTVLFGSIALWRTGAPRALRVVCVVLATPSVVFVVSEIVSDFGWNLGSGAKAVVFVAIYAVVIAATWPTTSSQARR